MTARLTAAQCAALLALQSEGQPERGEASRPRTWRTLDTFTATLHNDGRIEEVTEIQASDDGELLCYANPEFAQMICYVQNDWPVIAAAAPQLASDLAAALARVAELEAALEGCLDHAHIDADDELLALEALGEIRYIARGTLAKVSP